MREPDGPSLFVQAVTLRCSGRFPQVMKILDITWTSTKADLNLSCARHTDLGQGIRLLRLDFENPCAGGVAGRFVDTKDKNLLHVVVFGVDDGILRIQIRTDRTPEIISSECNGRGLWILLCDAAIGIHYAGEIPLHRQGA